MNESVQKFINHLNEYKKLMEKIVKEVREKINPENENKENIVINGMKFSLRQIQGEIMDISSLIQFLEKDKKEVRQEHYIYQRFSSLVMHLENVSFNATDKANIIFYIIEKNNYSYDQEKNMIHNIIDINKFKEFYAPEMDAMQFAQVMKKIDFFRIGNASEDTLSSQERIIKDAIKKAIEATKERDQLFMKLHALIQEHYLSKQDSFNKTDLKYINFALQKLLNNSSICAITIRSLEKSLEKRILNQKKKDAPKILKKENNYDYKALEKEVSKAVDLKDMFPKRPLSLEEKIYYLSILTRMNVNKEERFQFLRNCEMLKKEIVELEEYQNILNRLRYYEESVGLQSEIQSIEECLIEMTKTNPQTEEYLMWEEILKDILKKIEHWIPKNYEYEEEQVKLLLVQKEIEE